MSHEKTHEDQYKKKNHRRDTVRSVNNFFSIYSTKKLLWQKKDQ